VTARNLYLVSALASISISGAAASRADFTEHDAISLVRQLPEFREFHRFAHRRHSAIDISDNELVTDASRLVPPTLEVPAWRICVTHTVVDDQATGDAHSSKWNEFLVDARTGAIFVLWRVGDPYQYIPLSQWRRRNREFERRPNQTMQ
jgi:hypothetical protein